MNILIVEDHALAARALSDVLKRDGHRVSIAAGGREGVAAFRTAQEHGDAFDVVVTDFSMTDLDGLGVAASIKDASESTPVILFSAYTMNTGDRLPPNIDAVLIKPPRMDALRSTLARFDSRGSCGD